MAITTTKIGWANAFGRKSGLTWNFASGCSKVYLRDNDGAALPSACQSCYAEVMTQRIVRMGSGPKRYSDTVVVDSEWTGNVVWDIDEMDRDVDRLLRKKPNGIFVGSMTDIFHKKVRDWDLALFAQRCRWLANHGHVLMLLTKRADRLLAFQREYFPDGFPANIWPGVTVEHQKAASVRLEKLCQLNCNIGSVRWVSMEPLLTSVNIQPWLPRDEHVVRAGTRIGWVVAGCESAGSRPGKRSTDVDWLHSIKTQCDVAKVPFYVKQVAIHGKLLKEPKAWPQQFPTGPWST